MVERQKRNSFFYLLAASAPLLLAVLSSSGSPGGGGKRPAAGQENPAGEADFRKIGSRSITESADATSFVARRCLFQNGSSLTHVPMTSSLQKAPAKAREELTALLSALQLARENAGVPSPAPGSGTSLSPRVYQLHPQSDWIIDLSLGELPGAAGRLQVACNLRNK